MAKHLHFPTPAVCSKSSLARKKKANKRRMEQRRKAWWHDKDTTQRGKGFVRCISSRRCHPAPAVSGHISDKQEPYRQSGSNAGGSAPLCDPPTPCQPPPTGTSPYNGPRRRGRPADNALVEAFNSRFRQESLNGHWFLSMQDTRAKLSSWLTTYTTDSALGDRSPVQIEPVHLSVEATAA